MILYSISICKCRIFAHLFGNDPRSRAIGKRIPFVRFGKCSCKHAANIDVSGTEYAHASSSFRSILPGTASMLNIASAVLTLSIRTVFLPCSSSRTKRNPKPERAANSSCVRPAARRLVLTNSAILFTIKVPLFRLITIEYTL